MGPVSSVVAARTVGKDHATFSGSWVFIECGNGCGCRDGSRPAGLLERLYVSHVPKTTRIAYLLTGDAEVARELSHEASARKSFSLPSFRFPLLSTDE